MKKTKSEKAIKTTFKEHFPARFQHPTGRKASMTITDKNKVNFIGIHYPPPPLRYKI